MEIKMGRTNSLSYGDRQRASERRAERQAARDAGQLPKPGPKPKAPALKLGTPFTVLLTRDIRDQLGAAAYADAQSMGDWVRTAIITALSTRG